MKRGGMRNKSKLVVAAIVASTAAFVLLFNKGLDKIKELDLRDQFDVEDDQNDL
jgi:hypothetical protein